MAHCFQVLQSSINISICEMNKHDLKFQNKYEKLGVPH
uniref:Uncharacterized protein n=1 Tax=Curvibacter symbiont subsp. Hydra magnipapillata TaxID=667019 RepID=C9YAT9_CURXX|nr:hypothetical protein Csp_A12400 [Curvibacter putative symbiont of Hydra magnipapillata]